MGLSEREKKGLDDLGYQVGDKLNDIEEKDWKDVGLRVLEWKHILHADKKYRKLHK